MYDGSGQHEEVPDKVKVLFMNHIEYNTGRIEDAAHDQQEDTVRTHEFYDGLSKEDHAPSHDNVEAQGEHLPLFEVNGVQRDAGDGATCVQSEEQPAARAADQ